MNRHTHTRNVLLFFYLFIYLLFYRWSSNSDAIAAAVAAGRPRYGARRANVYNTASGGGGGVGSTLEPGEDEEK